MNKRVSHMKTCCKQTLTKELTQIADNFSVGGLWHFKADEKVSSSHVSERLQRIVREIEQNAY